MDKDNDKKFKEIFNKTADKFLDILNNNPDELFNIKNLSKQLSNKSHQIYKLTRENNNLKQALNEIREYCNNTSMTVAEYKELLQIIDKYMKED